MERREPSGAFERARLAVEEGVHVGGRIPEACVPLLTALDGRRTLAAAAEASGVGAETLAEECLPALRELLASGLLVATPTPER